MRGLGEDLPGQRRGAGPRGEGAGAHGGQLPSGELEEDVLEGALAERQRLGQHVVLLAPARDVASVDASAGPATSRLSASSWATRSPGPAQRERLGGPGGNGWVTTSRIVATGRRG